MASVTAPQTRETATTPAQADVAARVRAAYEASRAVYPHGGCTALDYGNSPTQSGDDLDLTGFHRIVDYTPRDMTILVEAGVRMAELAATLAAEGQHLPIDVPRAAEATIGGVVATNWCGPRRFAHGTIRDYVIGIHAVDGRGVPFKGGGRVVKNVAGYDFCKLLTGSLGTLGVLTQLALKVKPKPDTSATIVANCTLLSNVEAALDRLAELPAQPVAVDLLVGARWEQDGGKHAVVIRVEGTEVETNWFTQRIQAVLGALGGGVNVKQLAETESDSLWRRQVEFSDRGAGSEPDDSPLVVKIAVPSSAVTQTVASLLELDADCTVQAHAASGIVLARFKHFRNADLTSILVGKLRPTAIQLGGSLVVVSSKLEGLTPHLIWGGRTDAIVLLENIKRKFDPHSILNPGRFVF
jgi:glycolate oxidase FAD binding subunit